MLKIFASYFWIHCPTAVQKFGSHFFSQVFQTKLSRLIIPVYCSFFGLDSGYLDQFESETGATSYESYSDFFRRRYKQIPAAKSDFVWPCEGYVCDWGSFSSKQGSVIKGQRSDLNAIFASHQKISESYFFTNIFLHNHNYHRVHSPTNGTIVGIRHLPGSLIFLRPWFFERQEVSHPAFCNERVVIEIQDLENRSWFLALVAGFGVSNVALQKSVKAGQSIFVGQELAQFLMGSTVCLATPLEPKTDTYLQKVAMGEAFNRKAQQAELERPQEGPGLEI